MTHTVSLQDVLNFIAASTKEDRARISSTLSYMHMADIDEVKYSLNRGDVVHFNVNKRNYPRTVTGTVIKINNKTILVKPNDGGRTWRVTASLLKKGEPTR
jgi:hypothetical protein